MARNTPAIQEPPDFRRLTRGVGLFEGPTWSSGALVYTNVTMGGAFRLDPATGETVCVIPYRKGMGGLALAQDGGYVVSGRTVALKRGGTGETVSLAPGADIEPDLRGYNDLTIDPSGAVIVGSLGIGSLSPSSMTGHEAVPETGRGTGAIWRISRSGREKVASDIAHPNGVAVSPDGGFAYVSDTLRHAVMRFRISGDKWTDRETFASFPGAHTDGLALAADGSVWVALASSGQVAVLEPSGSVRSMYQFETSLLTSLCFGGSGLRTVFVTTGSLDGREAAQVLSFTSDVAGAEMTRADFA